jgi:hypothetical protein
LDQQVKQAELDLGEARRANSALGTEKQRVDETIERLQLETDSTGRALKATIADKEKQLVDHDVLKLQVGAVLQQKCTVATWAYHAVHLHPDALLTSMLSIEAGAASNLLIASIRMQQHVATVTCKTR